MAKKFIFNLAEKYFLRQNKSEMKTGIKAKNTVRLPLNIYNIEIWAHAKLYDAFLISVLIKIMKQVTIVR